MDCSRRTLLVIIRSRVEPDSDIHSDSWRRYEGMVDLGYKKDYGAQLGNDEFARGESHINGIDPSVHLQNDGL